MPGYANKRNTRCQGLESIPLSIENFCNINRDISAPQKPEKPYKSTELYQSKATACPGFKSLRTKITFQKSAFLLQPYNRLCTKLWVLFVPENFICDRRRMLLITIRGAGKATWYILLRNGATLLEHLIGRKHLPQTSECSGFSRFIIQTLLTMVAMVDAKYSEIVKCVFSSFTKIVVFWVCASSDMSRSSSLVGSITSFISSLNRLQQVSNSKSEQNMCPSTPSLVPMDGTFPTTVLSLIISWSFSELEHYAIQRVIQRGSQKSASSPVNSLLNGSIASRWPCKGNSYLLHHTYLSPSICFNRRSLLLSGAQGLTSLVSPE